MAVGRHKLLLIAVSSFLVTFSGKVQSQISSSPAEAPSPSISSSPDSAPAPGSSISSSPDSAPAPFSSISSSPDSAPAPFSSISSSPDSAPAPFSSISFSPDSVPAPSPDVSAEFDTNTDTGAVAYNNADVLSDVNAGDDTGGATSDDSKENAGVMSLGDIGGIMQPLDIKDKISKFVESSMIGTKAKTEKLMDSLAKRMNGESSTQTTDCLQTCRVTLEGAIEAVDKSLDDIKEGNFNKAKADISAVSSQADTCDECFDESVGEDPELKQFADWVRGVSGDILNKLDTFTS